MKKATYYENPHTVLKSRFFLLEIPFSSSLNTRHIFYDSAKTQKNRQ